MVTITPVTTQPVTFTRALNHMLEKEPDDSTSYEETISNLHAFCMRVRQFKPSDSLSFSENLQNLYMQIIEVEAKYVRNILYRSNIAAGTLRSAMAAWRAAHCDDERLSAVREQFDEHVASTVSDLQAISNLIDTQVQILQASK